ncbi:hypothetical protein Tco_1578501 [Tanacetum coccineum]
MKKNEEFRSLFILEMILEAKVSFVTRRGHVGGLEDDEERLLDELHELETSFDVLDTPCDAAAKIKPKIVVPNQNINALTLRSLIEKKKFNGSNFLDWHRNLRIILKYEGNLHHIDPPIPDPPVANDTPKQVAAYQALLAKKDKVPLLMLACMTSETAECIEDGGMSIGELSCFEDEELHRKSGTSWTTMPHVLAVNICHTPPRRKREV